MSRHQPGASKDTILRRLFPVSGTGTAHFCGGSRATPTQKQLLLGFALACAKRKCLITINLLDIMACDNAFDAFRLATESLGDDIYERGSQRSVWVNMIPRDEYPQGVGLERSSFTVGRSEPTSDEETWGLVALTSGETYTGACGTTWNDVNYGFNEVTYHPEQFGLRGPVICQDDLIYNFKAEAFLTKYLRAMAKRSYRSIENRLQNIYMHFTQKAAAASDFDGTFIDGATGDPPSSPDFSTLSESTCELTQQMLDTIAVRLNEEGAFEPDTDDWITMGEDGPIYPLLIGQELSQRILFNDANLRQDYRDADSGSGQGAMTLKRLGASRVIKNFRHVIDPYPPRFNFFDGVGYVRVNTWTMPAGTKGFVGTINPDWRTAPFEAVRVLNPWVYKTRIIRPVNMAAGLNWTPKNYMGEWQFRTGHSVSEDTDCYDPLEKLGRHFAEYKHAPEPVYPEFGWTIMAKRCPTDSWSCTTCTS